MKQTGFKIFAIVLMLTMLLAPTAQAAAVDVYSYWTSGDDALNAEIVQGDAITAHMVVDGYDLFTIDVDLVDMSSGVPVVVYENLLYAENQGTNDPSGEEETFEEYNVDLISSITIEI